MSETASRNVTAEPQFGFRRVMRPASGFTTVYQGAGIAAPIYFFPDGQAIDELAVAHVAGYDPTLARGLKTSMGSRLMLWIPNITWIDGSTQNGYQWSFIWRMRNPTDMKVPYRKPGHVPRSKGIADTLVPNVGPRNQVPASYNGTVYTQAEPGALADRAVQHLYAEDIEVAFTALSGPLMTGAVEQQVQQGIVDPASVSGGQRPMFVTHDLTAFGDELIVCIRRESETLTTWDFDGADTLLGNLLGDDSYPDLGLYVMQGVAP